MLFIGIPTYNEATTIGVLLWRLRTVLSDVSREYEVVVYDDASTDETADVLAPYARVLPLTLLRGAKRLGTGGAIDAIVRHVARTTRYPRRDGLLLMQGDFTDSPTMVPEFLRRFEGGADLIIGERATAGDAPVAVRRLYTAARWVLRPFVGISDVRDLTSSFRLARIAVLRDVLKASGDSPVASGDAWMAQADFLLRAAPHARRVETIPVTPTFGVRTRETRRVAWPDALALAKWGWSHRGQRIAAKVIARAVDAPTEAAEPVEVPEVERPERPERRDRAAEPVEKRGRNARGTERRERGEPRERPPRPPREKRVALPAAPAPGLAADVVSDADDREASPGDGTDVERTARKRRRGKRGAKRNGETSDAAVAGAKAAPDASGALAQPSPERPAEPSTRGETDTEREEGDHGAPSDEAEPKRRRARRGRRRRGEARDGDSAVQGGPDSAPAREEAMHGPSEAGGSDADRSADGEESGGARRRNRRGRRGGRRRTGGASGGEGEPSADSGRDGGAGPASSDE